ncbi:MAG: proline--tRNA ligase [Methanocellales archaeon]
MIEERSRKLPEKKNFSEWYSELLSEAEIVDVRYPVKGIYIWYPFGFKLRNLVFGILKSILDRDHKEILFPLLIPETEFMKEAEHIKGFENEVYWVTKGGKSTLEVPLALRPTSETAIYPIFKLWIRSHVDLPLKIYQLVNVFRYETKHTRPLIRQREVTSFKEAHTAHATWEEAERQVHEALKIYSEFFTRLGIPHIISRRPEWDKFPGADYTIAVETIMPDGKTLQIGTVHHLGTNFSKTFDITYEDEKGEQKLINQTCYGISERCIAAVISIHGDNRGLILPPEVAPIQIVIIPILFGEEESKEVLEVCREVYEKLKKANYRVALDDSSDRPGAKFYKWELKGVPIRIEIGPRDIKQNCFTLARRDTSKREIIPLADLINIIPQKFEEILEAIRSKAQREFESRIYSFSTIEEAKKYAGKGIVKLSWCESEECARKMENDVDASLLGEAIGENKRGKCAICGKESEKVVLIAKPY